jgi:hypothetical protein
MVAGEQFANQGIFSPVKKRALGKCPKVSSDAEEKSVSLVRRYLDNEMA